MQRAKCDTVQRFRGRQQHEVLYIAVFHFKGQNDLLHVGDLLFVMESVQVKQAYVGCGLCCDIKKLCLHWLIVTSSCYRV